MFRLVMTESIRNKCLVFSGAGWDVEVKEAS